MRCAPMKPVPPVTSTRNDIPVSPRAALLLATSVVFLTLAGYRAISQSIGDVYAALVMGAVYLLLAFIALLVLDRRRG